VITIIVTIVVFFIIIAMRVAGVEHMEIVKNVGGVLTVAIVETIAIVKTVMRII